jgi:hypothetical protein
MKRRLAAISTVCLAMLAGASSAIDEVCTTPEFATNCTASFTSVPDYIVSGDGTCVHGGQGPGGTPPTDLLETTVAPLPDCEDCTVTVTATWGPNPGDQETSAAKTKPWPHAV